MLSLLVLLLAAPSAAAQSIGCVEVPRDAPTEVTVLVPVPRSRRGTRAVVALPPVASHGHDCIAVETPTPPTDTLRGPPAPSGVLRGEPVLPRSPPPG